ncbi:hypothetical protein Q7A53_02070 [Halobacillus rhizosphaerae]|uniref:hypothetical protein n=1 Tax=Halobacillus rhizosphaerae TaxID=3064889 RepID=UPI00398B41DA
MRDNKSAISFLDNFATEKQIGFSYFLHFRIENSENVSYIQFNHVRQVHHDMYLIQYFDYDNKPLRISNFNGHQMHVIDSEIVKITFKERKSFSPSYVLN